MLTGFSTFDQSGLLKKINVGELGLEETIRITPGDKYFKVEFAFLNFVIAENHRYNYYPKGLEDSWQTPTTLHFLRHNNLPPGKYTLHCTAAAPSAYQNKYNLYLNLFVKRYFYQTTLFRPLFLFAV